MTGLRRADSPIAGRTTPVVHDDLLRAVTKINPIAAWTDDDVATYTAMHDLPSHPLTDRGYPSIGCWPCTRPADGDDPRAGRWAGTGKTECGLHGTGVPVLVDERRSIAPWLSRRSRPKADICAARSATSWPSPTSSGRRARCCSSSTASTSKTTATSAGSRTQQKLPLDYSCMVRTSVPGGVISLDQWLALDRLAELADGSMRLTTRQGVQYHFVPKGELHQIVRGINDSLLTTLAACGDVVRNVMACPLPHADRRAVLAPAVAELVRRFRPRTPSYWELWVDGERAVTAEAPPDDGPVEPLYGDAYLPRKFKIGIAWPGDNCIDIHSHDVGIVPTLSEGLTGELTGFVVLAGGGMGMSHSRPDDTYPVLGRPVAWVPPEDLADVVEAIVAAQRDFGNRDDRHRARLKYTLEERGIEWLRAEIETRTGRTVAEPVELLPWTVDAHHGWDHDTLGLPVPSGRVAGNYREALREVVRSGLVSEVRVTPRQDLLLCGVE